MSQVWFLNGDSTILPNSRLIVLDGGTAYYWGGNMSALWFLEFATVIVEVAVIMMFRDWFEKKPFRAVGVIVLANVITALFGWMVYLLV